MAKNSHAVIVSKIVQCLTYAVLFLPISLFYVVTRLLLWVEVFRLKYVQKEDGQYSPFRGGRMVEIKRVETDARLAFKQKRSSTYIRQLLFGCLKEFSKFVAGDQKVPLIPDDVLRHVITNTAISHGVIKGDPGTDVLWRLPLPVDNYTLFDGCHWDVREIRIHQEHGLSIVDRAGKVHTPVEPSWNLAKAHAQSQLTFFAPGMTHNVVHFVLPTLVAGKVRTSLPPDSVLRQLLEPHTKHTEYINNQALNVCNSSSNTNTLADRVFRPWLSFPMTNEDFLGNIEKKCVECYYDNKRITQPLDVDLHYHFFLNEYYKVVRKFVGALEPLIVDDYAVLASAISSDLPSLPKHGALDVVATLVWNCAVVHFSDHQSYLKKLAVRYGCMTMRHSLIYEEGAKSTGKASFENNPGDIFESEDVYHTKCFLRTFVRYNPNSNEDMTLANTKYDFTDKLAIDASKEFFRDLTDLDSRLRQRGEAVIPYSSFIRSVCF